MKILVTGGTTFVSRFTAEYFMLKGHDVSVLNRGTRKQVDNVTHICCDRTEPGNLLKGIHFDLVIDVTAYNKDHISLLLSSGIKFDDYIFISSSAVYPETNVQPFREDQICGPNKIWGEYGINKLQAEQFIQKNIKNAYILRPPYFYGIYENLYREALPFDCALSGREFYLPKNGEMKLQFLNVRDLCRFIEIITDVHPKEHIFNVGNKDTVTIKEWVDLCYKAAGKTPVFRQVTEDIPWREYFCFYDYEYTLDVSRQEKLMPDTMLLEQGLKEEFTWYINNRESIYSRKPYIDYIDTHLAINNSLGENYESSRNQDT